MFEEEAAQAGEGRHARDGAVVQAREGFPGEDMEGFVEHEDGVRVCGGEGTVFDRGVVGVEGVEGVDYHGVEVDLVVGVCLPVELEYVDDEIEQVGELFFEIAICTGRIAESNEELHDARVEGDR